MITIINNQPIRFQNEDTNNVSCDCLGQPFCQLINKNDATKFQLKSTDLVTNGYFDTYMLDGWDLGGSWSAASGGACVGIGATYISQLGILTIGKLYAITFSLDNMDIGGIELTSVATMPNYTNDGDYQVIDFAIIEDLYFDITLTPGTDGCIDNITAREIPMITIKDADGAIYFEQMDGSIVTSSGNNIQYNIDWSDFEDGCYYIHFEYLGIDYISDCISIKDSHECTVQLQWTNNENAFGFDYSGLSFTQSLRVKAKLWQPKYGKEKNVFKDSIGNRIILKSETSKEELLTVGEIPQYLHDALSIGLEHDIFTVDAVEYVNEETEYTPKWRKSSQLSPVEVFLIKDQNLKNSNC